MKYTSAEYISPDDMTRKQNRDQAESYKFTSKNINTKGKLLDIGCGNGKILLLAQNDGFHAKGLELSQFLAYSISSRYGIEVTVSDFLIYIPKKEELFDVVILRHVLEHLPDSILAMTKINQLLQIGGHGVLEFPDIESNGFKIKRILSKIGLRRKKYKVSYLPGHCNEFSKESFSYLLKKTGFELIKWENYSSKPYLNPLYNLFHLGSKARVIIRKIR
jgi:SAM-dependent methyltransferase